MMSKEQEIGRINELAQELTAENVHRLYIAAVTFRQVQLNPFPVERECSENLIDPAK